MIMISFQHGSIVFVVHYILECFFPIGRVAHFSCAAWNQNLSDFDDDDKKPVAAAATGEVPDFLIRWSPRTAPRWAPCGSWWGSTRSVFFSPRRGQKYLLAFSAPKQASLVKSITWWGGGIGGDPPPDLPGQLLSGS